MSGEGQAPVRLTYVTAIAATQLAFLRGQNRYMAGQGYHLTCIATPGPDLDALAERDGAETFGVPITRRMTPLADLRSLAGLVRAVRRARPDILHVSTPKAALLGAIAGWLNRVPVRIYFMRGLSSESESGRRRRFYTRLERLTARLCTDAICVAPSLLTYARTHGILRPSDGTAVGMSNGVDLERFSPDGSPPADGVLRIGFVGRLARDKGIEELAVAWQALRDRYPDTELVLVGPWEPENPVAPEVRRGLEQDPRVFVTGEFADPLEHYRRMSLFVYASHGTEGFPNAPMEAAAMALPVIATRVTGCVDAVVERETGTLVEPRDAGALEQAIAAYLDDPARMRRHGAAGRARVLRQFRNQDVWRSIDAEYRRALASAAGRARVGPRRAVTAVAPRG